MMQIFLVGTPYCTDSVTFPLMLLAEFVEDTGSATCPRIFYICTLSIFRRYNITGEISSFVLDEYSTCIYRQTNGLVAQGSIIIN
ncbi:hypothetical protein AAHA92_03304 [Salvia divinorum]|uniref:Uncharacterized protein n=1 Tax=Salvia divinorum TaxID=28513 RepID=A0ABD1IGP0_SALDI